jgi:hypothetical protein
MKRLKLTLPIILLLISVFFACKKDEEESLSSKEINREILLKQYHSLLGSNSSAEGACIKQFADSVVKWRRTYGPGGAKDSSKYQGERENGYKGFVDQMLDCTSTARGGTRINPIPIAPMPPPSVSDILSVRSVQAFLNFFGVPSICDQVRVDQVKLFIAPLNIIINRAAMNFGSTYYNSNTTPEERLQMIINNVQANELYLLEDLGTFYYFFVIATFDFPIPHIVAQKLFDLPSNFVGNVDPNGFYNTIQPWNGFLIDCSQTSLSPYCSIGQMFLPNPLAPGIYYQSQFNLLGQYIPHLYTTIFLNAIDNKYYVDNNFTSLVPNGYYDSATEVVGVNHKYYHIVNGSPVEILSIVVDPNGPTSN